MNSFHILASINQTTKFRVDVSCCKLYLFQMQSWYYLLTSRVCPLSLILDMKQIELLLPVTGYHSLSSPPAARDSVG